MSIDQLKDQIPDFAKDVRLNLASMMGDETPSPQSKCGLLLASAIATRNPIVTAAMENRRRRGDEPSGGRSGEIRSIRHGYEQRLLPLRSSRLQPAIQDNARSAADELAWKSPCGLSRFRIVGAGSKRNDWVRCLYGCP